MESGTGSIAALAYRGGQLAPVMLLEAGKKPRLMRAEAPKPEEKPKPTPDKPSSEER